jgi:chemotaxis protein MotB
MKTAKISAIILLAFGVIFLNGCAQEIQNLKNKNAIQSKQLENLESQRRTMELQLNQLQRQIADANNINSVNSATLQQQVAALEDELTKKKQLIESMQQKMLFGVALPDELNTMLQDFANNSNIVTYDPSRGLVKFKSDLLFESGSDTVATEAASAIKALCDILNSDQAKDFDIIVAGHTDDMRIAKPATLAAHRTNWHLSANRAISVMRQMANDNISETRMSIRGFGEFRPVAENAPNKKGNPANRRVEIFIVPKGI